MAKKNSVAAALAVGSFVRVTDPNGEFQPVNAVVIGKNMFDEPMLAAFIPEMGRVAFHNGAGPEVVPTTLTAAEKDEITTKVKEHFAEVHAIGLESAEDEEADGIAPEFAEADSADVVGANSEEE